jgi:UDP-GlcNAc:undecaprenyl-phosphate GlcNAc-1-phosphate transferase
VPALCLLLTLAAFALGLPATLAARALGRRLNALDAHGVPGQVKEAPRRVPNTGGVGIFVAVALPLLAALFVLPLLDNADASETYGGVNANPYLPGVVRPYVAGARQQTPAALILLAAVFVLHIVGLIDDRRPLGPNLKLLIMLAAAAAVSTLTDTRLLTLLDAYPAGYALSVALTTLYIAVVTNAFNFLDNMDGLSAGVGALCSIFFLVTALVGGQWFVAAVLAILLGALLAFLVFNFPVHERRTHPDGTTTGGASIFMGDAGSLILGFLLAAMSVRITYLPHVPTTHPATPPPSHPLLLLTPLIILAVPLYDFCSVVAIRLAQGRSPFVGDLQHFSHRLVRLGLSRRSAVLVIYGCTIVTGIGAVSLPALAPWQAALVGVQTLCVLLVIALFEWSRRS